jgi:LDH2 family malate/lactate/ureidoglycolate dehydrogenase
MPHIDHMPLRKLVTDLFQSVDLPQDQAKIMADHLVEANLMGHDSHGVIRTPSYLKSIKAGGMKPVGKLKIVRETPASVVIDGEGCLGIVLARRAMEMATDRALTHTFGAVAVHQCSHIGRLGDFPPIAAKRDCIGLLMLNGGARFTAPFGGTGRRLPPNPIAFSAPTQSGPPLMLDITTSMAAGGKVDVYKAREQDVPEGWLVDKDGNTVTDPNLFKDGLAAMLPLGGTMGHKGYGLGMMIEAIAGGLSWAGCSSEKPTRGGSGFVAIAININSFIDIDEYKAEIQKLIDWVKSSPVHPDHSKVYLPGEIEQERQTQREAEGIFIEDNTWDAICEAANELGVVIPDPK